MPGEPSIEDEIVTRRQRQREVSSVATSASVRYSTTTRDDASATITDPSVAGAPPSKVTVISRVPSAAAAGAPAQ